MAKNRVLVSLEPSSLPNNSILFRFSQFLSINSYSTYIKRTFQQNRSKENLIDSLSLRRWQRAAGGGRRAAGGGGTPAAGAAAGVATATDVVGVSTAAVAAAVVAMATEVSTATEVATAQPAAAIVALPSSPLSLSPPSPLPLPLPLPPQRAWQAGPAD
jgi:hypothetical protein